MHAIITDHLDEIRALCEKYKVKRLSAFGSVCTDRFTDESDIDLLYLFDAERLPVEDHIDSFLGLAESIQSLLSRPLDMVSERSLSNPYFIETMNETRITLYER